jgi:hypothetical protein
MYFITVFEKLPPNDDYCDCGATRCVGYYEKLESAEDTVKNNYGDIWETCYDYAVIENIEEGLYPMTVDRQFYKHNDEKDTYEPIDEPEVFKHYCNFGIG